MILGTTASAKILPATARPQYVLITAARNEEALIEGTIRSIVAQTVRPAKWIIVSDASTDRTDEIVREYASVHPWMELVRMPERTGVRHFAAKANCFNNAYAKLGGVKYDFIGNVDADLTFGPDFFEFLLAQFDSVPRLGVAGVPFVEDDNNPERHSYSHDHANLQHVSGACQLFRRECFEAVGGYVPVEGGAIDWIAVTTARMRGWRTQTFRERTCHHHRKIGTGTHRPLLVPFHYGRKAYYVGGHPVWAILRGIFQMKNQPWVIGGIMFQLGFLWAFVTRTPRVVSAELMAFHRAEQLSRLRRLLPGHPKPKSSSPACS